MSAVVKPMRRFIPRAVLTEFLAHVEEVYGLTFNAAEVFEYSDGYGDIRKATADQDKHPNDFWYVAYEHPRIRISFGHYPSDGGNRSGHTWMPKGAVLASDADRAQEAAQLRVQRQKAGHEKQRKAAEPPRVRLVVASIEPRTRGR
jgi:predicted DNA-binding WGR domain protein